jgi:GNAT superfamily N-acetyltransferase
MAKKITVRKATIEDMKSVHALVYELAVYEKAPEAHTATVEDYENDFKNGVFESHVAVDMDGEIIGMILYYMAYSTWKGRMLYLEDFVVTEPNRQFGVGQMLFDTYLEVAREKKCRLVKWQVLDWNEPAIKFYKKNNAIIEDEWYNGKIFLVDAI